MSPFIHIIGGPGAVIEVGEECQKMGVLCGDFCRVMWDATGERTLSLSLSFAFSLARSFALVCSLALVSSPPSFLVYLAISLSLVLSRLLSLLQPHPSPPLPLRCSSFFSSRACPPVHACVQVCFLPLCSCLHTGYGLGHTVMQFIFTQMSES